MPAPDEDPPMTITEPMTMATDYVLTVVASALAVRLYLRRGRERSRTSWSAAFGMLALSAFLGGSWHGFHTWLPEGAAAALWKATVLCLGVMNCAWGAGAISPPTTGAARGAWLAITAAKLAAYSYWMLGHDEFLFVVVDAFATVLLLVALHLVLVRRGHAAASRWILAGAAVSVAGGLVQAGGLAPHPHFNHNDLFHVIQVAGVVLFYRGAVLGTDAERAS
jgi:hypothetical protein